MKIWLAVLALIIMSACGDDSSSTTADDPKEVDMSQPIDANTMIPDVGSSPDAQSPDAAIGARPEVMPLEGTADLPGATQLNTPVPAGQSRAGRVTTNEEKLTGPEANCRVGDFRLDNAKVSVCLQAETTFSQFSFFGGNIVDAHLADRPGTDAFREVFIAPGLGEARVDQIGIVRDGSDGGEAVVRTEGYAQGALILQGFLPNAFLPPASFITTEYRLAPDSNTVDILTWVHIREPFPVNFQLVDFLYFGDRTALFFPENAPGAAPGPLPYVAATATDVTYAWEADFAPFNLYIVAALGLPGAPITTNSEVLNADDIRLYRRRLVIGSGDVESIRPPTDNTQVIEFNGVPKKHILVTTSDDKMVTTIALNDNGLGTAKLAPGDYIVRDWPNYDTPYEEQFTVEQSPTQVNLTQTPPGRYSVAIRDAQDQPLDGMVRLSGPRDQVHFVLGTTELELSPGEWTATISRGWHFSVETDTFTVESGQTTTRAYTLSEEIPLLGYASGEFHQHASPSLDSEVAVEERVKSNLAAGISFMLPSDHDVIYPYQLLIEKMGVAERISSPLTGEEISPLVTHIGAYGIPYDPYGGAGGALRIPVADDAGRWRVLEVPELIAAAREKGAELIQVNHPRASQGYFDHVEYEPEIPIENLDPEIFTTDFDTVEIFNSPNYFCRNFQDWQGLLNQGLQVTAIGNSDTHSIEQVPGYPRNYVRTLAPNPSQITRAEIVDSIRAGAVTMGGGAMMDFTAGPEPGDTVISDAPSVELNVRIRTPSFTRVDRLLVIVNGVVAAEQTIDSQLEDIVDFDGVVTVDITQDSHITLLALGDDRTDYLRPGAPVFAMSNPIWVDQNDDGLTLPGAGPITRLDLPFCSR